MKSPVIKVASSILFAATMLVSCKDTKEDTTTTTDETTIEIPAGDHGNDMNTEGTHMSHGGGSAEAHGDGRGGTSGGDAAGGSGSGNSGGNPEGFSGDGSDGRTEGTSVNKSKNVQTGGSTKKSLKGYSAPDGTKNENNDGDMYTKHDTTRMPSGSTPIK